VLTFTVDGSRTVRLEHGVERRRLHGVVDIEPEIVELAIDVQAEHAVAEHGPFVDISRAVVLVGKDMFVRVGIGRVVPNRCLPDRGASTRRAFGGRAG
jgi:hypothetical protein